ncbi:MAG: SDR family oxidoreductase [Nostocales cyanobacterium 94392]|nr:SDR family oxidoreductase [Nostocales cyanobacterium 94392]
MTSNNVSGENLILVAGATGGVGQLTVTKLLDKNFKVRVLTRNASKAENMFGGKVEVTVGDIRELDTLPTAMTSVTHIICCSGTTAFPSERWEFENNPNFLEYFGLFFNSEEAKAKAKNSPMKVDAQGVSNLVEVAPKNLQQFVFISSCGVERKNEFPYSILNSFGILDAKKQAEQTIINSNLPYTIIRPGRLIDGPYTSYDLNSLLKAKADGNLDVVLGTGDKLTGQTSRIDVANACVECLNNSSCYNKVFEIVNQGKRPSVVDWDGLFKQL